jgi:hypothetical protein
MYTATPPREQGEEHEEPDLEVLGEVAFHRTLVDAEPQSNSLGGGSAPHR